VGWVITYSLVVRSNKKQHKNQINHEVYKEIVSELNQYATRLNEFSAIVQSHSFVKIVERTESKKLAGKQWVVQVLQSGTNLAFSRFLSTWESYEIFLQHLQKSKTIFQEENVKVYEEFQNIFLFQNPENARVANLEQFEEKLSGLYKLSQDATIYLMDFKKVLQNCFYRQYGLKHLEPRTPLEKSLVLTEHGLVEK